MLNFREPPRSKDSTSGQPPPTAPQPVPPATSFFKEKHVKAAIEATWRAWWATVKPTYRSNLSNRPIGIRGIAHALHLELTNGWSFDLCLRFCEGNLIETPQGVAASPSVMKLTTRGRAIVDEMIAGAVTIALAGHDGYYFLGDVGRLKARSQIFIDRPWAGKGPDHLVAKMGKPSDGYVAQYMFLEAKGIAGAIPAGIPSNFYAHKTQSLNAKLLYGDSHRPILSYVYLPVSTPATPLVAQWFNAPERMPEGLPPRSKHSQALLLLYIAQDQFNRLLEKSQIHGYQVPDVLRNPSPYRKPIRSDGRIIYPSGDGFSAIMISNRALEFFAQLDGNLDGLESAINADRPLSVQQEKRLNAQVGRLRSLVRETRSSRDEFYRFSRKRFEVVARDATGITFLRRVLSR